VPDEGLHRDAHSLRQKGFLPVPLSDFSGEVRDSKVRAAGIVTRDMPLDLFDHEYIQNISNNK